MADMWNDLSKWENDNHAVVFVCATTEEIREGIQDYNAFDKECDEFICDINDVSETLVLEALKDAYDKVNYEYGINWEVINDHCYDYIVENLSRKTKETGRWGKGQIYNSETKTFERYEDFLARQQEKKNAS
tara:strand:- start:57 stop:452 length:396 start_codon:yes stop_codon:yes gene_type:complete